MTVEWAIQAGEPERNGWTVIPLLAAPATSGSIVLQSKPPGPAGCTAGQLNGIRRVPTLPFFMRAKSVDPNVVCGATPKKVRGGLASESAGASSATDAASARLRTTRARLRIVKSLTSSKCRKRVE